MNYYIQGNKEKAEQIKTMFGKLGYSCAYDFNYQSERTLYFTFDGEVKAATCESYKSIIKTHPDYQELELPVEPCFKANAKIGDLVYCDGILGRVTDVNEEQQEVTIGGGWTVYLDDGLPTFRKANQQDIDNILKGGEQ